MPGDQAFSVDAPLSGTATPDNQPRPPPVLRRYLTLPDSPELPRSFRDEELEEELLKLAEGSEQHYDETASGAGGYEGGFNSPRSNQRLVKPLPNRRGPQYLGGGGGAGSGSGYSTPTSGGGTSPQQRVQPIPTNHHHHNHVQMQNPQTPSPHSAYTHAHAHPAAHTRQLSTLSDFSLENYSNHSSFDEMRITQSPSLMPHVPVSDTSSVATRLIISPSPSQSPSQSRTPTDELKSLDPHSHGGAPSQYPYPYSYSYSPSTPTSSQPITPMESPFAQLTTLRNSPYMGTSGSWNGISPSRPSLLEVANGPNAGSTTTTTTTTTTSTTTGKRGHSKHPSASGSLIVPLSGFSLNSPGRPSGQGGSSLNSSPRTESEEPLTPLTAPSGLLFEKVPDDDGVISRIVWLRTNMQSWSEMETKNKAEF